MDWKSDRSPNFTIRQDSGAGNALGAMRIDMPNPHSVYMHDTNHKEFFSADYRFHSSGCARVAEVRDLATWLLEDTPGWNRKEIDAKIATGQRTDVKLDAQGAGGLGLFHRLGDARRHHPFPRRRLRPRRAAGPFFGDGDAGEARRADPDRGPRLGLRRAVGGHAVR